MAAPGIGRVEDGRLLTGRGRFVSDGVPRGALWAVVVRADIASGRGLRIDAAAAREMPGAVAVFTHDDLAGDDGPLVLPDTALPRDDGAATLRVPIPILAWDAVRHVGEPFALVVATDRHAAADAAEAVLVDLSPAPPAEGLAGVRRIALEGATRDALAGAAHVVRERLFFPRVTAAPLEPRGAVAISEAGGVLLQVPTQNPFAKRATLSRLLGLPPDRVRVVAPDVGASFGLKGFLGREEALVALAAMRIERPVAWVAGRTKSFVADPMGRGVLAQLDVGFDGKQRIVGLRAEFDVDLGAYPDQRGFGMSGNAPGVTGGYRVPVAYAEIRGHLSPRQPLAPHRGNGRPEATTVIEPAMDAAARHFGCDPLDLRRRNLLRPEDLPGETPLGFPLEVGGLAPLLDRAETLADRAGLGRRRAAAAAAALGRILGAAVTCGLESSGGPVGRPRPDHARIEVAADGTIRLATGAMSTRQGHETAMVRMAARILGVDPSAVRYVNGDTAAVKDGRGNCGSSATVVAASALLCAAEALLAEGRARAADLLGVPGDDVGHADGLFRSGADNRSLSLFEIAATMPGGAWQLDASFAPTEAVFPLGAQVAEVELDPQTGEVKVTRLAIVEDAGRVLNPDLLAGQVQGGAATGLATALAEAIVHDAEGQVLTGSPTDYALLRAPDLPPVTCATVERPSARNPLRVRGVGEAATVGATAAVAAALRDALAQVGVDRLDLPATPGRVWQAMQASAKRGGEAWE